jgi:hypothetical protein
MPGPLPAPPHPPHLGSISITKKWNAQQLLNSTLAARAQGTVMMMRSKRPWFRGRGLLLLPLLPPPPACASRRCTGRSSDVLLSVAALPFTGSTSTQSCTIPLHLQGAWYRSA